MNSVIVVAVLLGLIMFLTVPMLLTGLVGIWFSKNKPLFCRIRNAGFSWTILFTVMILGERIMPNL